MYCRRSIVLCAGLQEAGGSVKKGYWRGTSLGSVVQQGYILREAPQSGSSSPRDGVRRAHTCGSDGVHQANLASMSLWFQQTNSISSVCLNVRSYRHRTEPTQPNCISKDLYQYGCSLLDELGYLYRLCAKRMIKFQVEHSRSKKTPLLPLFYTIRDCIAHESCLSSTTPPSESVPCWAAALS